MGEYDEYLDRTSAAHEGPQNWISKRVLKEFSRVANFDPSDVNLLEIGTGTGRTAIQAEALGFKSYRGVEPTKSLADFSRTTLKLEIIEESLPNIFSVADNSVDAIVTLHVLEHASTYKEAWSWCEELGRMLKPGGTLLIAAPNVLDWKESFWDVDWSHGYPTTPKRVAQILNDLGLEIMTSSTMHIGSIGKTAALAAHILNFLTPRVLIDPLSNFLFKRPYATGMKLAFLWGLTFVVARKKIR